MARPPSLCSAENKRNSQNDVTFSHVEPFGVVVRIMGGLGNQLFQYASGQALALRRAVPLYLDPRWYETNQTRRFELDELGLGNMTAPHDLLTRCPAANDALPRRVARYIGRSVRPSAWPQVVVEKGAETLTSLISIESPLLYLIGYWQHPTFFLPLFDAIREQLLVSSPQSTRAESLKEEIDSHPNAISVHVRRGDYVADPQIAVTHGTQERSYYEMAMNRMRTERPKPWFFIFSDDPHWTRANLSPKDSTVVTPNYKSSYSDLLLMSRCQAHIIANSSFSWWGAILGKGLTGVVIAPMKWSRADGVSDPALAHWIRL